MWGPLTSLRRLLVPKSAIEHLFRTRITFESGAGLFMFFANKTLVPVEARALGLGLPDLPASAQIPIQSSRRADLRDLPLPNAYIQQVGRARHFGLSYNATRDGFH